MKRTLLIAIMIALALGAVPAFGQDNNLITLNDATPGIDAVITNPQDTTGVISLELDHAAVTITDSQGDTIFQMNDPRARMAELRFAPNTGSHTLTVERLPGIAEAHVTINALAELSGSGASTEVQNNAITLQQARKLTLSSAAPGDTLALAIPQDTTGELTTELPGASVTAQLVDNSGVAVATLSSGHIDGLNLVLDSGNYDLTLLNTNPAVDAAARVQMMPAPTLVMDALLPDTTTLASDQSAPAPAQADNVASADAPACSVTIDVSSINMRSGPGPGYSVMEYGYRGDEFTVGGYNPDHSWVLVGTNSGSAWMAGRLGQTSGDCSALPVFDIPYRGAVQPEVIVQQPEPQVIYQNAPSSGGQSGGGGQSSSHYEHDDEHEGSHGGDD